MATQPNEGDQPEGEVLELDEAPETPIEQPEDDDALVIEIDGDDEQSEPENATVKHLREKMKEKDRELAELRKGSAPKPVEIGPKPTLESCEWDEGKFETELEAWHVRKAAGDRQGAEQAEAQQRQAQEWQGVQSRYRESRGKLQAQAKIAPEAYQASEDAVTTAIGNDEKGTAVQGLMLRYLDDPALVTHVLGTKPQRLAAIAAEADPIKQFLAIYDLSKGIKVTKRKPAPPPEEKVSGSGQISAKSGDKKAAALLEKAQKSGDLSEYRAYQRSLRK